MKISVIVPVYNGANYISEAINSVLKQSLKAFEIIVIDDGSTDDSAAIIKSFGEKIKYVYQTNSGVSSARNLGIKLAKGDYLAFLDHDDIYLPDKLLDAATGFKTYPQADVIVGQWRYLFANQSMKEDFNLRLGVLRSETAASVITTGIFLGTYLFKRTVFAMVAGFDETLSYSEDTDLLMRIKDAGLISNEIESLCLLYRYHENNSTKAANFTTLNQQCTLKMLYRSISKKGIIINE